MLPESILHMRLRHDLIVFLREINGEIVKTARLCYTKDY